MSNVDKYFTQENSHKVFLCHINDEDSAKVIELQESKKELNVLGDIKGEIK